MEITPSIRQKFIVEHKLEIGKFLFYDNVMISEFYEGIHVTQENASEVILLTKKIYGNYKPFVYISYRKNSYSMDTMGYAEVSSMFPNLKGLVVVSQNKYRRMLASFEKIFIKTRIEVFDNMDSAFFWAEKLLEKNS